MMLPWDILATRRPDFFGGTIRFATGRRTYKARIGRIQREGATLVIYISDCFTRPATKGGISRAQWRSCPNEFVTISSRAGFSDIGDGKIILREDTYLYMLCPRKKKG